MPQSFAAVHVHLVFSTKNRERWLAAEILPRVFAYIGGVLRNHDCSLIAAGGVADHVHLLASLSRTFSIADAVREVKANSSGWIHDEYSALAGFQWQAGYGAFSVSQSGLDAVRAYLARQEEHHQTMGFQDEFRELLRRHDLTWDERYVWD